MMERWRTDKDMHARTTVTHDGEHPWGTPQ